MNRFERIKKFFRDNFFSGMLVVVPLVASVYLLIKISRWLYHKLVILPLDNDVLREWLTPVLPDFLVNWAIKSIHLAEFALVIIVLVFIVALVGMITKIRIVNWFFARSEVVLEKIPLVGMVYSAVKQLLQAIFSGKGNFSRVVLIEYPRKGIWSLGFVSRDADSSFSKKAGEVLVSVFIPTTPNPTSGYLLMVPKKDLIDVDISVEQAFKIIISAGMVLAHEEPYEVLAPGGDIRERVKSIFKSEEGSGPAS